MSRTLASSSTILLLGMLLCQGTQNGFKENGLAITLSDLRQFSAVRDFTFTVSRVRNVV